MKKNSPRPSTYSVGTFVWVNSITNGVYDIPRACKILSMTSKQLKVVDDDNKEFWVSIGSVLKELHPSSLSPLEDMTGLGELEEFSILRNIHIRYNCNCIYTYVGKMLIAVNPYKRLPIYSNRQIKKYTHHDIGELPAHIYAIGNDCFKTMKRHATRQCVVISGESGAGKTESTKLIVEYLALTGNKPQTHKIEDQIIRANPLLEAFGNAQTAYNDNSSRFGKFIVMTYNDSGTLEEAHIQQYLLEKSRVTQVKPKERNYHIFYQLLNGSTFEERRRLHLHTVKQFTCLNQGLRLPHQVQTDDLENIRESMSVLGFTKSEIWDIFTLLAAILHLGNIAYKSTVIENMENTEVKNESSLDSACMLLGVELEMLKETLSRKTILIHGKKTVSPVTRCQAVMTKNGFAKSLYDRLFNFVVDKINKTLGSDKKTLTTKYSIGILDIYGFEDIGTNSFEQLCINYTNEHLQQFFLRHIFKMEQEEYAKEGIRWENITYVDNENILDLIGYSRTEGLLRIIDEQSTLMTGTDEAVILKASKFHSKNFSFVTPKFDFDLNFGILHFAGVVFYNVNGFLEKNRNPLSSNWLQLMNSSTNGFAKELFQNDVNLQDRNNFRHPVALKTVASQYQRSLDTLMSSLNASEPYFIRCIKPNTSKKPNVFDHALCCSQLRYSGIMGSTQIRCKGYPIRYKYSDFVYRYRHITGAAQANKTKDSKKFTQEICSTILGADDYQFGKTKVFLKSDHESKLESVRNKILWDKVVLLQKNWKRYCYRKSYMRMKVAAVVLQKYWRMWRSRKTFITMKKGFLRLQASIRSRELSDAFEKQRSWTIKFQARCRGYLVRQDASQKLPKKVKGQEAEESIGDIDAWITSIFNAATEDNDAQTIFSHRL